MSKNSFLIRSVIVLAGLACGACNQKPAATPAPAPAEAAEAPENAVVITVTSQMSDVLAKADKVDGTEDKTVSKCASCNLGMDGSKEHALKVGEFTLLFCGDDCKQEFSKDLEKSVVAIKIP
jgi:hypothetical protein